MKLTGNKRSGRHLLGNTGKHTKHGSGTVNKIKWSWKKRALIISAIIVSVVIVLTAAAYTYYKLAVKPPDIILETPEPSSQPTSNIISNPAQPALPPVDNADPGVVEINNIRDTNKFTFLLLALDDGNGNTDTIMAATFDTANHTLEVVNIPRDTMVNVTWSLKKINSIYSYMHSKYRNDPDAVAKAMQDTKDKFAEILGFKVDFWFLVDIKAFVTLVNAVGGVDFYVPVNMNYNDNDQNLHISYSKGMHHLTGQQALEVVRFRSGYSSADIGRIGTQQSFLTAALQQVLSKSNSLNIIDLANTFIKYVKTDLPLNNLIWFGMELLKMDKDNISFETMPGNYTDYVGAESYVTINVSDWLQVLNTKLSPYTKEITEKDLSILTRGADRHLYVTDGNRQGDPSWGASSLGPNPNGVSSAGASKNTSGSNSSGSPEIRQTPAPSGNTPTQPPGDTTQPPGDTAQSPGDTAQPPGDSAAPPDTANGSQDNAAVDISGNISGDVPDISDNNPDNGFPSSFDPPAVITLPDGSGNNPSGDAAPPADYSAPPPSSAPETAAPAADAPQG